MSINRSIIEGQSEDINQFLAPLGLSLLTTPSLPPIKSSIAYDLTSDQLCVGNGTIFQTASTGTGSNYFVSAPVTAFDANGIAINNGIVPPTIFLEYATDTNPGICRAGSQPSETISGFFDMGNGTSLIMNALQYNLRKTGNIVSGSFTWVGAPCHNTGTAQLINSPDPVIPLNFQPPASRSFACSVLSGTTITYGNFSVSIVFPGTLSISYQGGLVFPTNLDALMITSVVVEWSTV